MINIQSVFYGRNDFNTCEGDSHDQTYCTSAIALSVVQKLCTNKESCSIPVTSDVLGGDQCSSTATSKYAIFSYICARSV